MVTPDRRRRSIRLLRGLQHISKSALMFGRLLSTRSDPVLTIVRLIVGIVFFAHSSALENGSHGVVRRSLVFIAPPLKRAFSAAREGATFHLNTRKESSRATNTAVRLGSISLRRSKIGHPSTRPAVNFFTKFL